MILLDANILLEMILENRAKKEKVLTWFNANDEKYSITMLTAHLVLHFGFKDGLSKDQLSAFLADYPRIALLPEDYDEALCLLHGTDHEDALQLAAARRAGCTRIVTLDKSFAETYRENMAFEVL